MQSALMEAVADVISGVLNVKRHKDVDISIDGQPGPQCPAMFIAVHPGRINFEPKIDYGIYAVLGVNVTISVRTGEFPKQNIAANQLLDYYRGADRIRMDVLSAVHMNYGVSTVATEILGKHGIPGTFVTGEVMKAVGMGTPVEFKSGEWFWAGPQSSESLAGYVFSIPFYGATFIQSGFEQRRN